eukprot:3941488-Rhodomonas_salina.2
MHLCYTPTLYAYTIPAIILRCDAMPPVLNSLHTPRAGLGFEGNGAAPCTPCAPGFEKTFVGFGACTPCTPGSYKLHTGPEACALCAIGTYKPASGTGSCAECPVGTTFSPPGSTGLANCTCDFGWSGNASGCLPCPAMTYKNFSGLGACTPCAMPDFLGASGDNFSNSAPASALCECNTGEPSAETVNREL